MSFNDADQDTIVKVLADVLTALCKTNDPLPPPPEVNKFHAADVPGISIHDYLIRIKKYAQCSTQCFVLALIYIDRLIQSVNTKMFLICSLNVHRILITAIMLAAKFFDDCYYNNRYYARIGGVDATEINQLEVEFLFMTNFQLYVDPDCYVQYWRQLCDHIANTATSTSTPPQLNFRPPQLPPYPIAPTRPLEENFADLNQFQQAVGEYHNNMAAYPNLLQAWKDECRSIVLQDQDRTQIILDEQAKLSQTHQQHVTGIREQLVNLNDAYKMIQRNHHNHGNDGGSEMCQ